MLSQISGGRRFGRSAAAHCIGIMPSMLYFYSLILAGHLEEDTLGGRRRAPRVFTLAYPTCFTKVTIRFVLRLRNALVSDNFIHRSSKKASGGMTASSAEDAISRISRVLKPVAWVRR